MQLLKLNTWHEFLYTVSMRDTDATGLVFHPKYLEILTAAREDLAERLGMDLQSLNNRYGAMLVVHTMDVNFIGPARLRSELMVKTAILKIKNAKITISHEVFSVGDGNRLILRALMTYAYVDANTLLPMSIPLEFIS
ncbi:acyl-CoA thioesterase [Polynucleobacter cosmopolitanus]|uniref:Uncharacterized protein n=1 Tax=Polynucleobacter cosmopolitanus TaxID=351345 RepID=A0A229FXN1_9BURK|nr:thioesterase family protein [Polynucleobacter cosmopolitanus]OXL16199.1 hypothetical protein AOC33_03740 [Polynucleobacter cosmopolitanus]